MTLRALLLIAVSFARALGPAYAQSLPAHYTVVDLGTLPGAVSVSAYGINSKGDVVGSALVGERRVAQAFVYQAGHISLLVKGQAEAHAINAQGQIAGTQPLKGGAYHAFLWQGAQATDLGAFPTGKDSYATAINDFGQVVGAGDLLYTKPATTVPVVPKATVFGAGKNARLLPAYYAPRRYTPSTPRPSGARRYPGTAAPAAPTIVGHAFLWTSGQLQDLGTLGGDVGSVANGINGNGQVVGVSTAASGRTRAFLYADGHMSDLSLGALARNDYHDAVAVGISKNGLVAGYADTSYRVFHAIVWTSGKAADIGTLDARDSRAFGVNSQGQVVGFVSAGSRGLDGARAFVWQNGQLKDLNTLLPSGTEWFLNAAYAINDSGQIVGDGALNGQPHAFLLNPSD